MSSGLQLDSTSRTISRQWARFASRPFAARAFIGSIFDSLPRGVRGIASFRPSSSEHFSSSSAFGGTRLCSSHLHSWVFGRAPFGFDACFAKLDLFISRVVESLRPRAKVVSPTPPTRNRPPFSLLLTTHCLLGGGAVRNKKKSEKRRERFKLYFLRVEVVGSKLTLILYLFHAFWVVLRLRRSSLCL